MSTEPVNNVTTPIKLMQFPTRLFIKNSTEVFEIYSVHDLITDEQDINSNQSKIHVDHDLAGLSDNTILSYYSYRI